MIMEKKLREENELSYEDFLATSRRCHYNQYISEFYERFAEDKRVPIRLSDTGEIVYGKDVGFTSRAKNIKSCCKSWTFDFYNKAGYKNLVRVDRCKDRFCLNCQSLVAKQRLAQYSPILDEYVETNDLYHVVLTVPNVEAYKLRDTVTLMLDRFGYMIRYFQGTKKVAGVDFTKWGYIGAVRGLEITVSKKNNTFHPHLHCVFVLNKNMDLPKVYFNRFSIDDTGRQPLRLFSELDMLFQRIWCLLICRKKVTKANIENIGEVTGYPDGFSCIADVSNNDYHEVFKYAIKGSYKNNTLFLYENFLTLYNCLFGKRVYQTYGCLSKYDFNDYDEEIGLNDLDTAFEIFLETLQESELPKRIVEALELVLNVSSTSERIKYISKATFTRHFKALSLEEKKLFFEKIKKEK